MTLISPFTTNRFLIEPESLADRTGREALLDAVMGPARLMKGSERLRAGRFPSAGLAFVARSSDRIVGTVRLWDVEIDSTSGHAIPALMLGPLAVGLEMSGVGIGSALMRHAIATASSLGHGAIVLVGDPGYYARFGFHAGIPQNLTMPGTFERSRLLGLEIVDGWLDGAAGEIRPADVNLRMAA